MKPTFPILITVFGACLWAACLSSLQAGVFDTNLIANADAEAGPGSPDGGMVLAVPGWTTNGLFTVVRYGASGGFLTTNDPGPVARGTNYFSGGPNNARSLASQVIDVSTEAVAIDAGAVICTLSGYLGGFSSQDDNAVLTAYFTNSTSTNLGSVALGPLLAAERTNASGLLFRQAAGAMPAGTRSILVVLDMTRLTGSYNDGYADNLSLVLSNGPAQPVLSWQHSAGAAAVSWPTNAAGFQLKTTVSLAAPITWTNWPVAATVQGNQFVVPVSFNESARFFRLEK